MEKFIFLDNNSTTKIDPRVLDAMLPFLTDEFANASSTHAFGLNVNEAVKKARAQIAELIHSETHEVIFTSGATEAINLAIKGVAESYKSKGKHIVSVSTEHSAVLDTCKYLEKKGYEVTYLPVKKNGLLDLEIVRQSIREDTILVSVMYVNNEIGAIQPIKEISEIAHSSGAVFMTDGTQAVGKIEINVNELGIDLMSFSAHKMYGPKGMGILYKRSKRPNKVNLEALLHGGGHEGGFRSGTLNVPGIVGLGKASEIANKEKIKESIKIKELRDDLETKLLEIKGTSINGSTKHRLFNTTNIYFKGINSGAMIIGLKNIAVSNGSACTSTSIEPSHVLKALGKSDEEAFSSIRFSLGRFNTLREIKVVIKKTAEVVNNLRYMGEN